MADSTATQNPDDWIANWASEDRSWHVSSKNRSLVKYFANLLAGRETITILVPLCGKAVDMMWMYELGHTVIGVEFAEKACLEFFTEQGVSYTSKAVPEIEGAVFKTDDERLKVYCCDLFRFSSDIEGRFDAIWDSGSFVTMKTKEDKNRYADHIQTLMSPRCRLLLEVYEYDPDLWRVHPYPSTEEDVQAAFYPKCDVHQHEKRLLDRFGQKKTGIEDSNYYVCIYSVFLKNCQL